jgi:hypothetical protein
MFESWIIISDVGVAPDYRGEWPKLAVACVETEERLGMLTLGKFEATTLTKCHTVIDFTYEIQYFNFDPDDTEEHESMGTIALLDVNPLYAKNPPSQLCCEHISEAVFGTHIAFGTLPELTVRK